jgi:hypothetical protein
MGRRLEGYRRGLSYTNSISEEISPKMQKNKQTHPRTEKKVTEQNGTEQNEPKGTEWNN